MDLADGIRQYFFDNFARLRPRRQFHFASRLAAWEGSEQARAKLSDLKPFMTQLGPGRMLDNLFNYPLGPVYADEARQKYFQKYPLLHGLNMCLFHVRHLKEVYGIDWRKDFLKVFPLAGLERHARAIADDKQALKFLSSFAVNHLYLVSELYGVRDLANPETFYELHNQYDPADALQSNLLVYLFTHCVIAESNFYTKDIPPNQLDVYSRMIEKLDELCADTDTIKLDAKLEYLVASRICGKQSPLLSRIHSNLQLNVDGAYIIDPMNSGPRDYLNSLNVSEHRNALYIMGCSAYKPHNQPAG